MIITDISAQNFLKYRDLEINDLPEAGVIAIEGHNESGKSTIGETICFALFGRTFSIGPDELEKLIIWGETRCSVNLKFRAEADAHYEIARFLDRDGNHGVRLNRVGEEDQPIARGIDSVDNALYELLGYGFDEFIESFYLAQREITTPHPHSHAVKTMAGISSMEYVVYEYEQEINQELEAVESAREETAGIKQELNDLNIQEGMLSSMEEDSNKLAESESALQSEIEALEAASTAYQDSIPKIGAAKGARGRAKLLRFFSFIFAIVLASAWGLMARMPGHEYTQALQQLLAEQIPQWGEQYLPWLLYGAAAFAALFLLLWVRVATRGTAISKLQEASAELAQQLDALHQKVPEEEEKAASGMEISIDAETDSELPQMEVDIESRPSDTEIKGICSRIAASEATPEDVRGSVGRELAWMRRELQQRQHQAVVLDQSIWNEKDRLGKSEQLKQVRSGLEQRIMDHERRVHLRELSLELLEGASRHLSQHFNRDLRDLVGRTLPMFTGNRYQHLQIEDDLTVRVFSNEKRDFMDLEEISSGTQRQIMLAVRLALAQELVNSTQGGPQFIFLDEPFAFFDQERTRSALKVLPDLSDDISQVWIVAQEFPDEQAFSRSFACTRENDALNA